MAVPKRDSVDSLTARFFREYPDYSFCQNLARNVTGQVITEAKALTLLSQKSGAERENRQEIDRKLRTKTVLSGGKQLILADLGLRELMALEDTALQEALQFYFRHPYAHRRTLRTRWLPRLWRTVSLSALVGHAKRKNISLDYETYFRMLKLL